MYIRGRKRIMYCRSIYTINILNTQKNTLHYLGIHMFIVKEQPKYVNMINTKF